MKRLFYVLTLLLFSLFYCMGESTISDLIDNIKTLIDNRDFSAIEKMIKENKQLRDPKSYYEDDFSPNPIVMCMMSGQADLAMFLFEKGIPAVSYISKINKYLSCIDDFLLNANTNDNGQIRFYNELLCNLIKSGYPVMKKEYKKWVPESDYKSFQVINNLIFTNGYYKSFIEYYNRVPREDLESYLYTYRDQDYEIRRTVETNIHSEILKRNLKSIKYLKQNGFILTSVYYYWTYTSTNNGYEWILNKYELKSLDTELTNCEDLVGTEIAFNSIMGNVVSNNVSLYDRPYHVSQEDLSKKIGILKKGEKVKIVMFDETGNEDEPKYQYCIKTEKNKWGWVRGPVIAPEKNITSVVLK